MAIADLVQRVGMFYAESLPVALAIALIPLVGLTWAAVKVMEHKEDFDGLQVPIWIGLAVLGIFFAVQVPAAHKAAKDYCREQWETYAGESSTLGGIEFTWDEPIAYQETKCDSIWPHGPD